MRNTGIVDAVVWKYTPRHVDSTLADLIRTHPAMRGTARMRQDDDRRPQWPS